MYMRLVVMLSVSTTSCQSSALLEEAMGASSMSISSL